MSDDKPATNKDAPDKPGWKSNLLTILAAVALALFIRVTLFEAFAIEGSSMEPSLLDGDRVLVAKYPYGLFLPWTNEAMVTWGSPNAGDVVIVRSPMDNQDLIKRVIGVGGDTVKIEDGVIYRNGEPLQTEEVGSCLKSEQKQYDVTCTIYRERVADAWHLISHSYANHADDYAERKLPEGYVFVLGDHRDQSNDSRRPGVGLIKHARVKGKALFIYLSWASKAQSLLERLRFDRIGLKLN